MDCASIVVIVCIGICVIASIGVLFAMIWQDSIKPWMKRREQNKIKRESVSLAHDDIQALRADIRLCIENFATLYKRLDEWKRMIDAHDDILRSLIHASYDLPKKGKK